MELLERFMMKVNKNGENGCWEWIGYKDKNGFGGLHVDGRWEHAHTVSYKLFISPIPTGIRISHTCNSFSCVNPEHLFAKTLINRFWAMVNKGEDNECWLWEGTRNEDGYGNIQINNHCEKAHRLSYELFIGNIPEGMCVCHKCDNPPCVNPKHLFLGTKLDNTRDRDAKGRGIFFSGEKHNMAKLTENQVREIRSSITGKRGELTMISERYGVSVSCISGIIHRRTWKEVEL
jgi:hypothetical protein